MPRKKAQRTRPDPRTDFSVQKKNLVNLRDRTPEERREIARKGAEARAKKKRETMELQKCMRTLLTMPISRSKDKQKKVLKEFGFQDEDLTNKTLLMVALFQKGLQGDVSAIRETVGMMDKLDMFEKTGELTNNVTINLLPVGQSYAPTEEDEKEIKEIENYDPLSEEAQLPDDEWSTDDWDDWDEDVYNGED